MAVDLVALANSRPLIEINTTELNKIIGHSVSIVAHDKDYSDP
jgi:hypothetical protein